jgi:RimJ/RimL family protein N-acetyltransferase
VGWLEAAGSCGATLEPLMRMEPTMDLSQWRGVPRPEHKTLEGQYTRLEPLSPEQHGDQLYEAVAGAEAQRLHQYLADPIPTSRADFDNWLVPKSQMKDPLYYAVIDKATGRVEGRQSILDINPDQGSAEMGHILWGPKIGRSRITTEAFFLFADYCFGLGYRRWQWRCNAQNQPSRRAAERFGYRFEGIFRNHMVVKGANRDTAWYSIIDTEWQKLKPEYEAWLDPSNFDEHGAQKRKLSIRQD